MVEVADDVTPDLTGFERFSWGYLPAPQIATLLSAVDGVVGPSTKPEDVPLTVLDQIGWDPVVGFGEAALTSALRDPELYYVEHDDPSRVEEVEEWLWPLLPDLLGAAARAIAYGSIPVVLDWAVLEDGPAFVAAHEIWPGDASLKVGPSDQLISISHASREYGADRTVLMIHDREFGRWGGKGTRRRVFPPWFTGAMIELWRARYYERSVDPPRIAFGPKGIVKIDGVERRTTDVLASMVLALKNGGVTALPSDRDASGNRIWGIELLDLPDRADVWEKGITRHDYLKMLACWVPPSAAGLDGASYAGARVPATMMVGVIQGICREAAEWLTQVVRKVETVRHGAKDAARVCAKELPDQTRKIYLEIFKSIAGMPRKLEDGGTVSLADYVDPALVDYLGIPRREPVAKTPEEMMAAAPGAGGPPGPDRDMMGDRETDRENGMGPESQDATGDDDE